MHIKRFRLFISLLLVLLVVLSLAACTKEDGSSALREDGTPSITPSQDDLRVVMTIDGHEITYDIYRYFFMNFKAQYDAGDATVWSDPEIGEQITAAHRETVLRTLRRIVAVAELAEAAGLTEDSVAGQVSEAVLAIYQEQGSDIAAYQSYLAGANLTDHALRALTLSNELEERLYTLTGTDIVDTSEAAARAAIEGDDFICVKQILIRNDDGEDAAANLLLAEQALARAQSGEDFDALITELSDDKDPKNISSGYYFTHYQYLEEFETAAFALGIGELSDVVETDLGYSIILRCEKDADYINQNFSSLHNAYISSGYYGAIEDKTDALPTPVYGDIYSLLTIENMK